MRRLNSCDVMAHRSSAKRTLVDDGLWPGTPLQHVSAPLCQAVAMKRIPDLRQGPHVRTLRLGRGADLGHAGLQALGLSLRDRSQNPIRRFAGSGGESISLRIIA